MAKQLHIFSKQLRVVVILFVILASFTGIAKAYELTFSNVWIVEDGTRTYYKTSKNTVGELLEDENIVINELDKMSHELTDPIENDMRILINRAIDVNVIIDDKDKKTIKTNEVTIGRVVLQLEKEAGNEYVVGDGYSSSSRLEPNMDIHLKTVREEITMVTENIPFEIEIIENDSMNEGTEQVKAEGAEGLREITTKTVYVGGEVSSSEVISNVVTQEPVNKVIEKGTAKVVKTEKGDFQIAKKLSMKATAYTSSSACTGKNPGDKGFGITASGMKAQVGVVAVDPSVIPLGTKLYVEGYGYAVAGDTGGAIKGHKIDLYFNSHSEAIRFGIKNLDVYVLND